MSHWKCGSLRTECCLCPELFVPKVFRETQCKGFKNIMLVLISFEWQKKMEHLKIIKPHCLSIMLSLGFRYFWDMHEMPVATKRQKLEQVEDNCLLIMWLFLSLVCFNLALLDCTTVEGEGLFLLVPSYRKHFFSYRACLLPAVSGSYISISASPFLPLDYCVHPHSFLPTQLN